MNQQETEKIRDTPFEILKNFEQTKKCYDIPYGFFLIFKIFQHRKTFGIPLHTHTLTRFFLLTPGWDSRGFNDVSKRTF